jgi:hypothetical protein
MKDPNDLEVIIDNQRIMMAALKRFLKAEGAGKHEEAIELLDQRLGQLTKRETQRLPD